MQTSKNYPQIKCSASRGEGGEWVGIKKGEGGASGKESAGEENKRSAQAAHPPAKVPPKDLTAQADTAPNLTVPLPDEEEAATGTALGVPVDLPAKEEAATEAAIGTAPNQVELHITATFKIPYPNAIILEGWERYTLTQQIIIASHYHCPTITIFEDNYLQLVNGLASSEYSKFVSHADSIPDGDAVHPTKFLPIFHHLVMMWPIPTRPLLLLSMKIMVYIRQ